MTRRTLLSLPFVAPIAKAAEPEFPDGLALQPSLLPSLLPSDDWLRAICPEGWEPWPINGILLHDVYDADGTLTPEKQIFFRSAEPDAVSRQWKSVRIRIDLAPHIALPALSDPSA